MSSSNSNDSGFASISSVNLYLHEDGEQTTTKESVMRHLNELGSGACELPPFTSITKLVVGKIYSVKKIIKRVVGEQNANYTGIQVYLDNCRTNLPSKCELFIFLFF